MLDEISPSFPRLINNGNKDKIVQLGRIKIIIVSFQKKKFSRFHYQLSDTNSPPFPRSEYSSTH